MINAPSLLQVLKTDFTNRTDVLRKGLLIFRELKSIATNEHIYVFWGIYCQNNVIKEKKVQQAILLRNKAQTALIAITINKQKI